MLFLTNRKPKHDIKQLNESTFCMFVDRNVEKKLKFTQIPLGTQNILWNSTNFNLHPFAE